ncbi:MAG: hypothetical protein ACK5RC_14700 [Curvibacter sp.]|jgi:hypothetical protein
MAATKRIFRLGLAGLDEAQTSRLMAALIRLPDVAACWRVVENLPFDALLLARGSRASDPDDMAVLRLFTAVSDMSSDPQADRRSSILQLRKPIADAELRAVLLAALDQLRTAP